MQPRTSCEGTGSDSILGALLGDRLADLPPVVRRLHAAGDDVICEGALRIGQSTSRIGRRVARLAGMPAAVGDTPVSLMIRRSAGVSGEPRGEQWSRSFQSQVLASTQTTDGEHLVERVGWIELCYDLDVADERLGFRHVRTRARVGRLRVPIPRWLSPTVEASVGATPAGDRLDVSVRIVGPLLGTLLHYSGQLELREIT